MATAPLSCVKAAQTPTNIGLAKGGSVAPLDPPLNPPLKVEIFREQNVANNYS